MQIYVTLNVITITQAEIHHVSSYHTHLFGDPHVEVVEVGVAAVGLPALLAAVLVASEHGDGVQRVGLTVVVANPCSTPEAGEIRISYPTQKNNRRELGEGS